MDEGDRVMVKLLGRITDIEDDYARVRVDELADACRWYPVSALTVLPRPLWTKFDWHNPPAPESPVDTVELRSRHVLVDAFSIGYYCAVCVSLLGDVWPCETIKLCDALDKVHQEMATLCLDNVERLRGILGRMDGE